MEEHVSRAEPAVVKQEEIPVSDFITCLEKTQWETQKNHCFLFKNLNSSLTQHRLGKRTSNLIARFVFTAQLGENSNS